MVDRSKSNIEFKEFRAPAEHGSALIDPTLDSVHESLHKNRSSTSFLPAEWMALSQAGRTQLIDGARRYTSAYRSVDFSRREVDSPIVMAGHQPALFHPGVWFKNFALDKIARDNSAIAVNLVVDNDVAAASTIRVPTRSSKGEPLHFESIAYDQAPGGVPYEQTEVVDRERFNRFDAAVADAVKPIVVDPCIRELWPHAIAAVERCGFAGCALAQARHAYEGELGLETLEVPIGVMCRSVAFATFALRILNDLPKFHDHYNGWTEIYRAAHGIRSKSHPVPNLGQIDDWYEAPFWLYGNLSPQRRGVWVRKSANGIEISDHANRTITIDRPDTTAGAEQLFAAMTPEFKLRSRALVTTMYARLVLSDLFLHGIGGGKYDQLGDQIIQGFFEVTPPTYMVMSATIKLPGACGNRHRNAEDEMREIRNQIRQTHFQPERFVGRSELDASQLNQRAELLRQIPPRGEKRDWHGEITEVTRQLADQLQGVRIELATELQGARQRLQSQSILCSREHPFCIFPADQLVGIYQELLTDGA